MPHTGGHCPAVLGPREAATASRKSHPRSIPGGQWKGWGHHGEPGQVPMSRGGTWAKPLAPWTRRGRPTEARLRGSREPGTVAGSQHLVPLIDCFQRSEERLAPDSGVSEEQLCLAHPQCLGTRADPA